MTGGRWLILADDLTGAADCAIAFAKRGLAASVGWGDRAEAAPPGAVFSFNTNSRALPAAEAAARQAAALDRFFAPDQTLYKKIDSTLRGQPAAEIAAAMAGVEARTGQAFGIVAPAFPGTGRAVRDARVHVAGAPLEEAEVWQREHSYPSADLLAILATAGLRAASIPLRTIRGGTEVLRAALRALQEAGTIAVCDGETDDDLRRLAQASMPPANGAVFVGSAGLAAALAGAVAATPAAPPLLPATRGGTLVVVGSLAAISREAARHLAAEPGVRYLPVHPATLSDPGADADRAQLAREVGDRLQAGGTVLVELLLGEEPDVAIDSHLVSALAAVLEPVAPSVGALAATGGETAASILSRFGIGGIRLLDEVEPGVSLGLTLGRHAFPVVTKAGAFGGPDTLVRIVQHLARLRPSPA